MIMNSVYLVFPEGREKALTLSYDDGVDTDIRMIDLMEKYGIKCTFNISAGLFNPEDAVRAEGQIYFRLPKSQAVELYRHPLCEVATHGYTHPHLNQIPLHLVMNEIMDDRRGLEECFGGVIRGHAYPYGRYTDQVVDVLKMAGIVYARTPKCHHTFQLPDDWMRMGATCTHTDPRLEELTKKFVHEAVSEKEHGWLFYMFGHTYEFRRDNNWDVIENFAAYMGRRENIWYATNGEIYQYVQAYHSLVFSAAGDMVYNPSATDIYLNYFEKEQPSD